METGRSGFDWVIRSRLIWSESLLLVLLLVEVVDGKDEEEEVRGKR